ncbi:MAG TPA: NAD(P)H-hydrate dehydratase [Caulobacteraceae bacterium]
MPREILTCAETAAADRAAIKAGTPGTVLMERAGKAVAGAILQRFARQPVVVLCGPGNNGGDGYVVAAELREHGWTVEVEALADPATDDAKWAAERWGEAVAPLSPQLRAGVLYIDGLFGAGLSRPLEGVPLALARQSAEAKIVAIDVPSGLAGDTGAPLDGASFEAALTVTFHRRKPAHLLEPGRSLCGEVVVADIGLGAVETTLWENEPSLWAHRFPWPASDTHKHARGRLIVVSGEATRTGAARLAARAGLRIGAGLVTVLSPPGALAENAAHLEAVMLRPFETDVELASAADDVGAAVIGPAAGVGPATRANLLALARTGAAMVVDADALTTFRERPADLFSALDRDDVLTPHPGEFERLFPGLLKASPHRIAAAREAAKGAGAIVLLKGPDTVIAAPDGRTAVNVNGSPWLATAGSGDVLAGFIGGLLAQNMDTFEAACAAAWIHAECAALHGPGLTAEDLPNLSSQVLARLYAERPRP